MKVSLVSPFKQTNDQLVSKLRRESEVDSIKSAALNEMNRSMKRKRKKGPNKRSGKKRQKTQKRRITKNKKKKMVKRGIQDIFTL